MVYNSIYNMGKSELQKKGADLLGGSWLPRGPEQLLRALGLTMKQLVYFPASAT